MYNLIKFDLENYLANQHCSDDTSSVGYQSRGMSVWTYRFGANVEMVKNLDVTMTTNFSDYDFPIGTISPDTKEATDDGMRLVWKIPFTSCV